MSGDRVIASERSGFVRYVGPLFAEHRVALTSALLLNALHGAAITLQNVFPKWLFERVLEPRGLSVDARWRALGVLVAGYFVVSIGLRMGAWHASYRLFTWVRERVVFALRSRFFRHVNELCLRFHGEHSSGELFSYLFGTPLSNVMQFFQHVSMSVPGAVVTIATTLVLFWQWDVVVALVLVTTSFASVGLMLRARRKMQSLASDFQSSEGEVSGRVADVLRGSRAVKLHAMEERVAEDFDRETWTIGKKSFERDVRGHVEYMKQETFGYVCYAALTAACTYRYLDGHVELGVVAACLASFVGLNWPIQVLFQAFALWGGAAASIDRIAQVLDTPSSTPDPDGDPAVVPARATIRFEDVSFGYVGDARVIERFTLSIPYGQRVALVGPSGAGKSTVTQLALRLYDPDEGVVSLGGVDLRRFEGAALRRTFGVVPQDPFLFRASIRDNLRVARPDATDDAIRAACERANAWEFIGGLAGGLDAPVGEGGTTLSGGQRQRLAIARALLSEPDYFVFDEATSALDTRSERLIQEALGASLGGRTAIFIAHRLSTVRDVDRIVVLDRGAIVQDGSYDELVARDGLFLELVRGAALRTGGAPP